MRYVSGRNSVTSFSAAKSRTFTSVQCNLLPSNMSRTSFRGIYKFFSQSMNKTVVTYPEVSFTNTLEPGGIPSSNLFFFLFPLQTQ
jgi:hypothetical protein